MTLKLLGTVPAAPTTSAVGDSAAAGSSANPALDDHKHGREAFATNTIALGTAAAAGSAVTLVRSDATIAAFDATAPTTSAVGDAAAVGSAVVAARRDHLHGREQLYDDNVLPPYFADFEDSLVQLASGGANVTTAITTAQALHGTHSMSLSSLASGDMSFITNTYALGVGFAPGATVTAMASFRSAVSARSVKVGIEWKQANGATISTTFGTIVADTTSGWTQATCTAVAPALTFAAEVVAYVIGTGAASEVHYIDELSLAHGTSTSWLPGTGTFPYSAAASNSAVGDVAAAGSSSLFAHGDHVHGREAFATPGNSAPGDVAAAGSATTEARSDHKHGREAASTLGTLGYAQAVLNQGSITTQVDLTSLSVTVTVGSGRRIKITGSIPLGLNTNAGSGGQLYIMESTTQLMKTGATSQNASTGFPLFAQVVLTPTAGSHTYKLQAQNLVGGTYQTDGNLATCFILVEDIGT